MRFLVGIWLILMSTAAFSAPKNLATINNYFVDFQSDVEVGDCRQRLLEALEDSLVRTTSRQINADAIYVVNIKLKKSTRMRDTLSWAAAVYSRDSRVLFRDSSDETGWNAEAACYDAAEDIADELADEIREARVNRGRTPSPSYLIEPDPERVPEGVPRPTVAPKPRPVIPNVKTGGRYELKERAIGDAPQEKSPPVEPPGPATNEPSKWRKSAELFARKHQCSLNFESVQSLPSGAEIYVTRCGQAGRSFITCSAHNRCDLSF